MIKLKNRFPAGNLKYFQALILICLSLLGHLGLIDPVGTGMSLFFLDGNSSVSSFALVMAFLHGLSWLFIYAALLFLPERFQVGVSTVLTVLVLMFLSDIYLSAINDPSRYF